MQTTIKVTLMRLCLAVIPLSCGFVFSNQAISATCNGETADMDFRYISKPKPGVWVTDKNSGISYTSIAGFVQGSRDPDGMFVIYGTDGKDVIIGSEDADDIYLLEGIDTVCSVGGKDKIDATVGGSKYISLGEDDDSSYTYGGGKATIYGGSGNDIIQGNGYWANTYPNAPSSTVMNAWGGTGNDRLSGSQEHDVLRGEDGDDQVWGWGDDDAVTAGKGKDKLWGGEGWDTCTKKGSQDYSVVECEQFK